MVAVQVGFAGLNVLSKLALDDGMSPFVMIAYRQLVATLFLSPLAIFLERYIYIRCFSTISLASPSTSYCYDVSLLPSSP
ncbi:hypothetical protein C4D60_Mb07t11480 [Musa balbisiana]|uniref:WAT1-related protein n=1 Tax=Musa balbisiana TaxID=52838 RepID=A0A4S8JEK9_MUSBA|nr:hypothetical protein C4D60_Mb07t11480 [Musa balbisiana]